VDLIVDFDPGRLYGKTVGKRNGSCIMGADDERKRVLEGIYTGIYALAPCGLSSPPSFVLLLLCLVHSCEGNPITASESRALRPSKRVHARLHLKICINQYRDKLTGLFRSSPSAYWARMMRPKRG